MKASSRTKGQSQLHSPGKDLFPVGKVALTYRPVNRNTRKSQADNTLTPRNAATSGDHAAAPAYFTTGGSS